MSRRILMIVVTVIVVFAFLIVCSLLLHWHNTFKNRGSIINETVTFDLSNKDGIVKAGRNNDGTYTIIDVTYDGEQLELPDSVPDGSLITEIKNNAFDNLKNVEYISLPDGLLELRLDVFSQCSRIKIIKIGSALSYIKTFYNLDLAIKDVILSPQNQHYNKIGHAIVERDSGSIILATSGFSFSPQMRSIGKCAFSFSDVDSIEIPNYIVEIEDAAFMGCKYLKSASIPNSINEINEYTFCNCAALESVSIPDSVTKIGAYAFANTAIKQIPNWGNTTEINPFTFSGCHNLVEVIIPSQILRIYEGAFYNCQYLKTVILPCNLEKTNVYGLFDQCESLEAIYIDSDNPIYYSENGCLIERKTKTLVVGVNNGYIPYGIKRIGDLAFSGRVNLDSVIIPSSVEEVGALAFNDTPELEYIYFPISVVAVGKYALFGNSKNIRIELQEGINMENWDPMWNGNQFPG